MTNHPITPPPEVVDRLFMIDGSEEDRIIAAYRAGADQELEACVSYVDNSFSGNKARALRALRRPKPPSLKEQALAILPDRSSDASFLTIHFKDVDLLRRALEALDD